MFLDLGVEPLHYGLGIAQEDEIVVVRFDLQVSRPRSDRRFARELVIFVFSSVRNVNVAHWRVAPGPSSFLASPIYSRGLRGGSNHARRADSQSDGLGQTSRSYGLPRIPSGLDRYRPLY